MNGMLFLKLVLSATFCHNTSAFLGLSFATPTKNARVATSAPRPTSLWLTASPAGTTNDVRNKTVVVIGGGWAGFSAADALATATGSANGGTQHIHVEVLDASPRGPGGLAGGWRTPVLNRPVEAGLHGFWREYRNTFAAMERIGLDLDDVLTPFMPSVLYSESGKVALAPVLGSGDTTEAQTSNLFDFTNPASSLNKIAELLPPPLDVALLSEFDPDSPLTVTDRISALGLLGAWADFEQEDDESWKRYDSVSAETLFRATAGISPRLYDELVSPLLHVLPMTPGYDCSAAAALSCFHVFALQAKGAFDVRWCRGTISERIFNPWAEQLQASGQVNIRGSSRVTSITECGPEKESKYIVQVNDSEEIECDSVVLAVGITAAQRLLTTCPPLAAVPQTAKWDRLRGVTCVAVRLFFKPNRASPSLLPTGIAEAMADTPVAVCGARVGNIPELAETGFCIYDMQRLQDEFSVTNATDAALEVDFYRANDIASIEDDQIVAELALKAVSAALNIGPIDPSQLVDISVVRARNAVSHFCVGSASGSPDVKLSNGLYACGDWIDRTGHSSWSTEKSVVTGRQAALAIAADLGMDCGTTIIPAAPDTAQLSSLRKVSRLLRGVTPQQVLPRAPWA